MRIARNIAALIALGTVAFAVGDFASHPNAVGAIGLILLVAVFSFLLSYLFRPPGERAAKPAKSKPQPKPETPKRAQPAVWAGWDAEEAKAARERRKP